jgi:hypothetical protein
MPERRLNTAQDVRRYLAGIINRLENKKITPEVARQLTYAASLLIRVIEIDRQLKNKGEGNSNESNC